MSVRSYGRPGVASIEVRGLTKTFGRVTAVRDVSFTAPAGMITGLTLLGYAAVFAAAAVFITLRRDVT